MGFIESTAMRHRWGGGKREKVGFIENTAMRHRWGGGRDATDYSCEATIAAGLG